MPPLTQEQQRELVRRYQGGDRYAGDLLLRQHRGFIKHVARRYIRPSSADFEDAVQAGGEGFLEGVRRFDGRPVHLLTYVDYWIRNGILRSIHSEGAVVRFPEYLYYAKTQDQSGIVKPRQRGHKQRSVFTFSEMDNRSQEDTLSFEDTLIAEGPSADETLSDAELDYWIPKVVAHLLTHVSPKARDILMRRSQEHEETHAAIGATYGVGRGRIQQIEAEALSTLRRYTHTIGGVEKTTLTFQQWVGKLIPVMLAEQLALVEAEAKKRAADLTKAQQVANEKRAAKLARSHATNVARRLRLHQTI